MRNKIDNTRARSRTQVTLASRCTLSGEIHYQAVLPRVDAICQPAVSSEFAASLWELSPIRHLNQAPASQAAFAGQPNERANSG